MQAKALWCRLKEFQKHQNTIVMAVFIKQSQSN